MKCTSFKLVSCILILTFFQAWCDPLLVVVLMVKNEAAVIEATLQPYVDGGVKDFLIFDTGSTDGTQKVAASFFERNLITNFYIKEEPFIDFAPSRNRALELSHILFPQATFILMPDAEWYMHNVEGLLQFCAEHQNNADTSYFVPIRNERIDFCTQRLIRCHKNIQFVGIVHEALNQLTYEKLPYDVYFEWRPSAQGNEKSAQRWLRDREKLLRIYHENPYDPRNLFYLGQTYHCLGDWENAYFYYQKRAEINGWDEEDFITHVRLGEVAENLSDNAVLPLAVQHYLKAYSMRPQRAEPLVKIAQYYLAQGNMHLAFLFASRATQLLYPDKDVLFIDKQIYNFTRYDVLGISAWYVGEYNLGEWAVVQALKADPEAPHLWRNLLLFQSKTKETISSES